MSKRNEHVVAILLEPVKVDQEFIEWPLHITIVPWFPCDDVKKLDTILTNTATAQSGFWAEVGGVEKFGPNKNVEVSLIKDSPELSELHWRILNTLEKSGFGVHQKEYVGEGYKAHITHQSHGRKHEGEKLKIQSFALIKQIRQKKTGTMIKALVKEYKLQ